MDRSDIFFIGSMLGFAVLTLGSCTAPAGNPNAPSICPTVTQWSRADLADFIAAERALPAGSPIMAEIGDYKRMRDEARACAGR